MKGKKKKKHFPQEAEKRAEKIRHLFKRFLGEMTKKSSGKQGVNDANEL